MKKKYVAPELDKIQFDITDIITHSLATGPDDTPGGTVGSGGSARPNVSGVNAVDEFNII